MNLAEDLVSLDAVAQAELVRAGELTAREVVEATIDRIESLNPRINAVVTKLYDRALQAADGPLPDSTLAGAPMLLKDFYAAYGGVRQTEGSQLLADYVAPEDSELVARLKRAGMLIVAKTNTPEFATLSTTEGRLFGSCRNPWDTERTPGGSSGGSAAAVAARLAPIAHGNDVGGSIRIPASCCGVFGLKPTRARNPLGPENGEAFSGLFHEHALAWSVRDSAALLDVTSGGAPGDPYVAPPPERSFLEEVRTTPGRLRIALSTSPPGGGEVHADCVAAVEDAAQLCGKLGHEVAEAAPAFDVEAVNEAFFMVWCDHNAWLLESWGRKLGRTPSPDDVEPLTWAACEIGAHRSAREHLASRQRVERGAREIAAFFGDWDLWLTPTIAQPPPRLGILVPDPDDPLSYLDADARCFPFSYIANITGQPAMSVPLFWNGAGLPIGTQFVGRYGDEATLFRLAAQLEEARPWQELVPRVSAVRAKQRRES